nr:HAMP domain-containing protein [uncultured Acetobacterium sp.]
MLVIIEKKTKRHTEVAQKIAAGDFSEAIAPSSKSDPLESSLTSIQKSVGFVLDYLMQLPELVEMESCFDLKQEATLAGNYRKATDQLNLAMNLVSSKRDYFQAVLDAMPYRVTAVDNDSKITFLNKTLADLMKITGTAAHREDMYGTDCSDCNLQMCKTENCGITAFKKSGRTEYPFEFRDRYYRMDTNAILNRKGETIGYLEISHDTTPTESVAHYTKKEVQRLEENLERLSSGNLDFNIAIQEPNEYTHDTYKQFMTIENNLIRVKDSISDLIEDATQLTRAAIRGELNTRADEMRFGGAWQKLIKGMNGILEKISKPIDAVVATMDEMSEGNLDAAVSGNYKGSFELLKTSVNTMGSRFKTVVTEISAITEEIGNGNLNIRDVRVYQGDFNAISISLNTILEKLNALLGDINDAAEQVNAGANQISDSSQSLAQGSTEQASSIQELTASITEIADQTKNNAVDANKASALAAEVMENADQGNRQMIEM